MSGHFIPWQSTDNEQEFMVPIHLWLSAQANANYKGPKKSMNRREKSTPSFEDARKLKEKSSWANTAPRGSTAGGLWRPGICRLREQNNRCVLNVFVEESVLMKTVHIHLLNHTDIRPADPSLFLKKNCLAIDAFDQKTPERLYIMFGDEEACSTWLCLLRSFCVLEIYGRWVNPEDGGLYRLWRQIELNVTQARNLGLQQRASNKTPDGREESDPETTLSDADIFCEVWLNGLLCARTSAKRDDKGAPEWHETFTFPDLPPFDKLEIVVWQEVGKAGKSEVIGKVKIPLATFRRGESVDGRYPVLRSGSTAGDLRVGEMRLKIKVEEEIVLPFDEYRQLYEIITRRNFLCWLSEMDKAWKCKSISWSLTCIALATNRLVDQVIEFSNNEILKELAAKSTLFRGNSIFTKAMESCMIHFGKPFLEASLGSVLRRLRGESITIEVDPVMSTAKSTRDLEKSAEQLVYWCSEFWKQIYVARSDCPNELRRLFEHIRKTVGESAVGMADGRQLQWQSISSFCFLRFLVPAIIHPHLFGLWPGMPDKGVQRTLTLIGKAIQSLSNLNTTQSTVKENLMKGMKEFLIENSRAMTDYLTVVSSPTIGAHHFESTHARTYERREQQQVLNALRQRQASMPNLSRQSIPTLPYLLDNSRHLAVVTSIVLRHTESTSRSLLNRSDVPPGEGDPLTELVAQCFLVEESAKNRVKQLARATMIAKPSQPSPPRPLMILPGQPLSPIHNRGTRKHLRPATAPASGSESDTSRRRNALLSPTRLATSGVSISRTVSKEALRSPMDISSQRSRGRGRTGSTGSIALYDINGSNLRLAVTRSRSVSPHEEGGKRKRGLFRGLLGTRK